MNDTVTQDHLSWLQDRLASYESKLSEAESTVARLRPIVSNLQGTIEALASDDRGPTPQKDLFDGQPVDSGPQTITPAPIVATTTIKPFKIGNQNPNMPARRAGFARCSLIEAAGMIINGFASDVHADTVTKSVFEDSDRAGFLLAKRSMASEMYRGAKKGLWTAQGDNWYRRK